MQSFTVEVIKWTGSGDGLIVGGTEVVLWIRRSTYWEVAWKLRAEVPQALVSASWFAEGPVATAPHLLAHSSEVKENDLSPLFREACKRVLVYHSDGKSGAMKVPLCHPEPVSMIQWRPSIVTQYKKDDLHSWRDVLLTCCLDGTVRLWSEIDNGRARKFNKDAHDQKTARLSFHVIAVIEVNQCLKGTLGTDISVEWAIEFGNIISKGEGGGYFLSSAGSEHDQVGKCEWLISVGPRFSVAFWALHCLDDVSPLRFPRVSLWKKQDLMDFKARNFCNSDFSNSKNQSILVKIAALRSCPFGPPVVCSLLQLLPDNTVSWSQVYSPTSNSTEERSLSQTSKEKILSRFAGVVLNQEGHTGKIIQLAVHPYSSEIELAVSMDTNGLLLFWSLSTLSLGTLGTPMLVQPEWERLGKLSLQALSTDVAYSSLKWAPPVLDEKRFLLLGHANGIDCFLVNVSRKGEDILCHKILTIPFAGEGHGEGPPYCIFATPLASTCGQSFASNSFLVFSIWMEKFRALSWKVVLHSEDPSGSNCSCNSDSEIVSISEEGRYRSSFAGKMYYATLELCSSRFPDLQNCDQVTSVAVVPSDNSMLSIQQYLVSYNGLCGNSCGFQMATGFSNGILKLWKISRSESTISEREFPPWELVGMFTAHQGPVSAVSLSSYGGKIATISMDDQNGSTSLHIWESIFLIGGGSFLLEDAISLNTAVVALNWLSIGNGQLLLGVCMPNELRIYSEKRSNQILRKSQNAKEMHIWNCIALYHTYPVSHDFLWGPKVTPILVHEKHFSIFSQWLFKAKSEHIEDHSAMDVGKTDESLQCAIFIEKDVNDTKESSNSKSSKESGNNVYTSRLNMPQPQFDSDTRSGLHNVLDLADKLRGSLAVYHPKALIQHLYSGNWKRAFVVLKHLVRYIKSNEASTILESTKSRKSSHSIPQINLFRYFEGTVSTNLGNNGLQWGQNIASGASSLQSQSNMFQSMEGNAHNISTVTSRKSEIMGFIDTLEESHITAITDIERTEILAIVDLLGEISDSSYASAYESLDEPGRRFWVSIRFQCLLFHRKFGKQAAAEEFIIDSRLVAWAFQSDCQDNLLSSILSAEPSWLEMRNLGAGYWFSSASQLRTRMEKLARLQYLKNKDPKDCALLYLALNRIQVLAGLFKVRKDEKDKLLVGFLSRNFQEEKNKAAALKNAYVLMGRRQLELAIAFFLLGGDPSSAVTVCAKNLGDGQLALVICRLIEGYGGSLERHLISNVLLPNAIEKGDYWLSSLLEWTLGNYSHSFKHLFGSHMESVISKSATLANRTAFSDPEIGQYCVVLAAKNCLKNSFGDYLATVLFKFSTLIAERALNSCGLPLEALESLSSSCSIECKDQGNLLDIGNHKIFHGILNPFSSGACNWLLGAVASDLESNAKLNLAMQYISKLLKDHPSWPHTISSSSGEFIIHEYDTDHDEHKIGECKRNLNTIMSMFEQKYSLKMFDLANMTLVFACNMGLLFHGYRLLQDNISGQHDIDHHSVGCSILNPVLPRLLLKANKEILYSFTRYVVSCSFTDSTLNLVHDRSFTFDKDIFCQLYPRDFCLQSLIYSLKILRPLLKLYEIDGFTEGLTLRTSAVFDLLQYCVYFTSTWFRGNVKGLTLMIHPILDACVNDKSSFEVLAGELQKLLHKISELMLHDASSDGLGKIADDSCKQMQIKQIQSLMPPISEDEMWQLISACLWIHISGFAKHQLSKFLMTERLEDESSMMDLTNQFPLLVAGSLITSLAYISSSITKQLASFLRQKALKGLPVTALFWLDEFSQLQSRSLDNYLNQGTDTLELTRKEDTEALFKILWEISVSPKEICENFVTERVNCFPYNSEKLSGFWKDIQQSILSEYENGVSPNNKTEGKVSSSNNESGSLLRRRFLDMDSILETRRKDSSPQRDITSFHNPREVIKRSGELLEALCFNSLDERQVVVTSNRKGLLYFNWKTEQPFREQGEYIWSESDWPQDGWAGCESTPIPTYVSQGIGLGIERGAHLGLGGATIGLGSLARPGRDLTGGGAFGIPGYAGIGASGLGWGEQEDFEQFIDPPATVENISSRALSRHPSRPFFLVGSSNTHVYLWEFGKDRATATYGVLPAANVPPPYALASISALQFDHCGHRFATAALDGTVCTWQLEVGGRSNVHPTQSSLCFNNHATDVAFVAASGSILAAAGCSSNGVNVVVWDTLAPLATSQASLVCHEGGARSLSVFDNDIGSGSISPLIVTGGKSGDVGLHDFRFIATGRTKKHRHSSEQDLKSMHETSKYGEDANGMIWYIPKAHLGSVTKIATIPNTSLFLTGSKDGDVKLWDAKRSQLVFHWQKMHDRHTFLQPNSRGFGGVVRAAVTDIQVLSHGFLTCGGDGSAKLVQLK